MLPLSHEEVIASNLFLRSCEKLVVSDLEMGSSSDRMVVSWIVARLSLSTSYLVYVNSVHSVEADKFIDCVGDCVLPILLVWAYDNEISL